MIRFEVILLNEIDEFLNSLSKKAREKIIFNIWKAKSILNPELFKKLTENIWEFRTLYQKKYYRLLAF